MVKIACMSDIHNCQEKIICPAADILVVAGDLTSMGELKEIEAFSEWLRVTPYAHKIIVAGNHDWGFQRSKDNARRAIGDGEDGIIYLEDEGAEILGLKFWGSPWQPEFCSWAFNVDYEFRGDPKPFQIMKRVGKSLEEYWDLIPEDIDVLVTHGPPYQILDMCPDGEEVGSKSLLARVLKIKPRLHVFGHIHHSQGKRVIEGSTFVNASVCDEMYRPLNKIEVIEL